MADTRKENYADVDKLAEEFLIVNCVWDPADKFWQESEALHPALQRHLSEQAFSQGDFTLRYWRGEFYKWQAGRYFSLSDTEHLQNPHLVNELSLELPGIFNWAFEGLKCLRRKARFTIPQKCKRAVEQYRLDVNPARAFLLDNYVADFNYDCLPCQEVYACYVRFCQNNGYRPLNSNNFGKEVKRALPGVTKGQKREGIQRVSIYHGLAVQEGSEVAAESIEGCQQWQ